MKKMAIVWLMLCCCAAWANGGREIKLFTGSCNPKLAEEVAHHLGIDLSQAKVQRFNDGEINIQILDSIRNCDVFILQSTCSTDRSSVNDNLMELFLMIRTMKRASANSVTAVIPYFGYARQDRKKTGRVPISASDVAMLVEMAGADRVMAIDLHCGQIQGFFHNVPVDNLFASVMFAPFMADLGLVDPVIISPDAGGVERAKIFMEGLHNYGISSRMAIIIKQRAEPGVIDTMSLVGEVQGSDAVIVDDICDTAGTLVEAAKILKEQGARRVFACITHPVFSGQACARIKNSCLDALIVADTIPFRCEIPPNVKTISVGPLLAKAISRTWHGESLSELLK